MENREYTNIERKMKQEKIDMIVAQEMKKVRRRKQWNEFWKFLTVGFSGLAISVYAAIYLFGNPSEELQRWMIGRGIIFLLIIILILKSPKATSWIAGVEDRGKRRKEFE
ncbi:MAG: hypothetical protein D6732_13420 [Methanobacteriota archaeon]|nr:MAG: hypothetical protein D6732_13420 [Euryarchaeota archaeon]